MENQLREIQQIEIFHTLRTNDSFFGNYFSDEFSRIFKGILGALEKGIGYTDEYVWIYELIIRFNKQYFGENVLQLKYKQNEILEPYFEENIYVLFHNFIHSFRYFKGLSSKDYLKNDDIKLEFDTYQQEQKDRYNLVKTFYANQQKSYIELDKQYKKRNLINEEIDLNNNFEFERFLQLQKNTDFFMIEVSLCFCHEVEKRLFIRIPSQDMGSSKTTEAKNPNPDQKKFLKAFAKNLTDGYKLTYAIEEACKSSQYSKRQGQNLYRKVREGLLKYEPLNEILNERNQLNNSTVID